MQVYADLGAVLKTVFLCFHKCNCSKAINQTREQKNLGLLYDKTSTKPERKQIITPPDLYSPFLWVP